MFPAGANRIAMFYFSSDQKVQGPGFEMTIRQHSCDDVMNSHENRVDHVHQNTMCDQVITREKDVITSPFYPNDYGSGLKCKYTIIRSSSDVCHVRLQFISFDMEPSPDCRADYLMLDSTRERLCRTNVMSSERIVAFGQDGQVRLTFSSDAQVARPGFKIVMNQLRGSCNTPGVKFGNSWNTTGNSGIPFPPIIPSSPGVNRGFVPENTRICNSTSASFVVIASEGYPSAYRPNTDCIYRINRRDSRVCGLEVFFQDFSVGTWESGRCINDFLKIGDQYFCGFRKNERVVQAFPDGINSIDLRFFTDHIINFPGFVIEVRQVDICGTGYPNLYTPAYSNVPVSPYDLSRGSKDVGPVYRSGSAPTGTSSTSPSGGPYCGTQVFTEEKFELLSPGYEKGLYSKFTDCHYTIRKMHYTVCALEVKFKAFSLEDSSRSGCDRDFVQFGKSVKLCGKLPFDTISK